MVSKLGSRKHIKMSSLSSLISHSAPKTKKTNNPDNKKETPKPNQTAKIYINLHMCLTGAVLSKNCISNQPSMFMNETIKLELGVFQQAQHQKG